MKRGDELRVNEVVRINAGRWRGLVGEVVEMSDEGGRALVRVSGVKDDAPVDFIEWFKLGALGRNDGK